MLTSNVWTVRDWNDVPFYCRPVALFFSEWILMLAAFQLQISYTSYPDNTLAFLLFLLAATAFLVGYWLTRGAYAALNRLPLGNPIYEIDIKRLRAFHVFCVTLVLSIMAMNLFLYGLPPIFGFFGVEVLNYQEYGSFRQPLFTAILVLFVSAPLESCTWRRWALYLFGPACMLIYSSRGYLLVMLFQMLVVFSLRTRLTKTKIYAVAGLVMVVAVFASNYIGNSRNSLGVQALLGYLQIKRAYYDWPAAYLWVISYVSTPFSNMCWIVHTFDYRGPSWGFLYSALPGFLIPTINADSMDLTSEYIVDGVHTYMAKYFYDFWYLGIIGINFIWGAISAYISAGDRLTRNFMVSGVLLGCMGFMFFSDFLTILIILLELLILALMQKYVTVPLTRQASEHREAIQGAF